MPQWLVYTIGALLLLTWLATDGRKRLQGWRELPGALEQAGWQPVDSAKPIRKLIKETRFFRLRHQRLSKLHQTEREGRTIFACQYAEKAAQDTDTSGRVENWDRYLVIVIQGPFPGAGWRITSAGVFGQIFKKKTISTDGEFDVKPIYQDGGAPVPEQLLSVAAEFDNSGRWYISEDNFLCVVPGTLHDAAAVKTLDGCVEACLRMCQTLIAQ